MSPQVGGIFQPTGRMDALSQNDARRRSTAIDGSLPLRAPMNSAIASAAAAMAAQPRSVTGKADARSPSPVAVTASSARGSPPRAVQAVRVIAARTSSARRGSPDVLA
jgi:hypothetical protein